MKGDKHRMAGGSLRSREGNRPWAAGAGAVGKAWLAVLVAGCLIPGAQGLAATWDPAGISPTSPCRSVSRPCFIRVTSV